MDTVFAVGSSLGVEVMSSRYRVREDSAIAVVWAVGMAIGVIFVFLTPGYVPEQLFVWQYTDNFTSRFMGVCDLYSHFDYIFCAQV